MNVTIETGKCFGCWECVVKCSGGCFTRSEVGFSSAFDGANCIDCMACTEPDFCPNNAITIEVNP